MDDAQFTGFHFAADIGTVEVFWMREGHPELESGWYWWPCLPGCFPDGDATGPFPTAHGAYLDALGE